MENQNHIEFNGESKYHVNGCIKSVTHVIFDLDGLLIDSEAHYEGITRSICLKYGKDFTWEFKQKLMGLNPFELAKVTCKELDLPITPEELVKEEEAVFPESLPNVRLMPGVEDLLVHLHRHKVPFSIATSSGKKWFPLKTKDLEKMLSLFHHILMAPHEPRVKKSKPAPDTFLVSCAKFSENEDGDRILVQEQVSASSCLVFEDSVNGVMAGVRAGMQVVMIPDPRLNIEAAMESEPDLRPTIILNSLKDFRPEMFGLPPFD